MTCRRHVRDMCNLGKNGCTFCIPWTWNKDAYENVMDGVHDVILENPHMKNSHRGTLATDEGSWTDKTAKAIGKDHQLCVYHKSANIMAATKGLTEGLGQEFVKEINAILYEDVSEESLQGMIDNAKHKFSTKAEKAKNFIEGIDSQQAKVCYAHVKFTFSVGHVSTQRGESQNSAIKSNGVDDVVKYLHGANLAEMHTHVDSVHRKQLRNAAELLGKLRLNGCRVSDFFKAHLDKSIRLSALNVISIERNVNGLYKVEDSDGNTNIVNLSTKIVHRGNVYTIYSCQCAFWSSRFIPCKCIVRACNVGRMKVDAIQHIHPYWHIQRHPCWGMSLDVVKLEDYNDFPFNNSPSLYVVM
eukprot:scaffold208915_cov40-Cyclotella_meneghiniana.AAC.2